MSRSREYALTGPPPGLQTSKPKSDKSKTGGTPGARAHPRPAANEKEPAPAVGAPWWVRAGFAKSDIK